MTAQTIHSLCICSTKFIFFTIGFFKGKGKKQGIDKHTKKKQCSDSKSDHCSQTPMTGYEDYADILLSKQPDMLPGNPVIWIQTTWEGGKHPIKVAPYTRSMLDTYRNNVMACLILSTSREKGSFVVASTDKFL